MALYAKAYSAKVYRRGQREGNPLEVLRLHSLAHREELAETHHTESSGFHRTVKLSSPARAWPFSVVWPKPNDLPSDQRSKSSANFGAVETSCCQELWRTKKRFFTLTVTLPAVIMRGGIFSDIGNLEGISLPEAQHFGSDADAAAQSDFGPIRIHPAERHVLPALYRLLCTQICLPAFADLLANRRCCGTLLCLSAVLDTKVRAVQLTFAAS